MARRTGEGVRIGPITLLTLVSVLLLAVLAMLCVTTTHATEAMAQRQADALSQTYELDAFGQALLAQIDDSWPGVFVREYVQAGPDAWRIRFTRRACPR